MGLEQFLRSVGFEEEDIRGGLLAEHPTVRLNERREQLKNEIRKVYGRLVRHRRALEEFRRDERRGKTLQSPNSENALFQGHEQAYARNLQLLGRLLGKLKHVQGKLARNGHS
jgi:hypothetical protein